MYLYRSGGGGFRLSRKVSLYVAGVALTTIVASAATAPFEIYHFNRLTIYGLAANLGAMPVTALWVMPWGILALILMPVGLEELALVPMGWGTAVVITVAETVSSWPGAVRPWPAVSIVALALCGIGGLWLCLWRKAWRWCGLGGIAAGIACAVFPPPPPDVIVDGQARLFAVGVENGGVMLSTHKAARFITEVWLRRVGNRRPKAGPDPAKRYAAIRWAVSTAPTARPLPWCRTRAPWPRIV